MLPALALVVPVKAKLGEDSGNFRGLLIRELYPDPLTDNLRYGVEIG